MMKINFNNIIQIECPGKNVRDLYAFKILKLQCDTFQMREFGLRWETLNVLITLSSEKKIFWQGNKLHITITSSADMSLALLLQMWAIRNSGIIIHGALLKLADKSVVVTGTGGVGKTYLALNNCRQSHEAFTGDDLVLFHEGHFYPIVRPLCLYPEHMSIKIKDEKIQKTANITILPSMLLRIIRKITFIGSISSTLSEKLFFWLLSHTTSRKAYAYVSPSQIRLKTSLEPVTANGLVALKKDNNNIRVISNKTSDSVSGTKSEFLNYYIYLDFLTKKYAKLEFEEYLTDKIKKCTADDEISNAVQNILT